MHDVSRRVISIHTPLSRFFLFYRIFDISSTYAPIDASHLIPEGSSTSNIDLQRFTKVFAALFRLILINPSFGPPRSLFRPILHISGRFSHRFSCLRTRYRLDNVPQPVDIDTEQLRTPSPHTLSTGRARPGWPEGRPGPTLSGQGVRPDLSCTGPARKGSGPEVITCGPIGSTRGRPSPTPSQARSQCSQVHMQIKYKNTCIY